MRVGWRLLGLTVVALGSVLVGVLGTAAAGPTSAAAPAPASAMQATTLRVGHLPITAQLDVMVARDRGWFTEEGLNVELTSMAGGAEILPALIGGSLDIGTLNVVTHILAHDQGFRDKAVAGVFVQR